MGGTKSARLSAALGLGALKATQFEVLQRLAHKHLTDKALVEIITGDELGATSTERGIPRYEHSHLVAALDITLMYQCSRRARSPCGCSMRRAYGDDPRSRFIELMKCWLRANAVNAGISEDEVRRICAFVRDVMNYPQVFPSRNKRSFLHTLAELYDHLRLQLREVLQRDRTCAELASRAMVLSRNLISDAIAFLLLAPTDLKQTDDLASLEVVALWQTLPADLNPLPRRVDLEQQRAMEEAWSTLCGSLVASLLTMRWAVRIFGGKAAEEEARASLPLQDQQADDGKLAVADVGGGKSSGSVGGRSPSSSPSRKPSVDSMPRSSAESTSGAVHPTLSVLAQIAHAREEFEKGNFKSSGLAGAFREPEQKAARQMYLDAVEALLDLVFLLGEVFTQFHRISDGLGDYGMIRVAPWLHPFLEALSDKVQRLKTSLEALNEAVDSELVVAKARGRKIKKPHPTEYMSSRAHAAIDRVVLARECHATLLVQTLDELRSRSAPERLPHVAEGLSDACLQLQAVLTSPQFRARVGDAFPEPRPLTPVHGGNLGSLAVTVD